MYHSNAVQKFLNGATPPKHKAIYQPGALRMVIITFLCWVDESIQNDTNYRNKYSLHLSRVLSLRWVERWWPWEAFPLACLWIFLRPSTCGMMSKDMEVLCHKLANLFTVGNLLNWPPQTTCHRYVLYKLTFDLCSHTTSHFYHTHNTAVWYTGGKCTQTSIPFIYVPGPEIWGHRLEWTTNCQRVWLPTVDPNGYDYWSLPCWHFNWNVNSTWMYRHLWICR